ncbi:hypothetical protein AGABI2DRAFT_120917 [Agaricus bisporus var. bisporus H97]|uniref:hypothetical protein n=1 Tax=Agaricus bisporus var. bisporus (strain H97 / ATCC MYA-4626 / FGSC 10389) TaxID=936046 RepID=UPI00029F592C|nr:hypothetical protein AGABI2DRAFT_120917 [Agaricus bisporus var. bisporus H97]EKV44821.1 hypothetical protein AGABI2DRAFT_120917 [Agaricus bisporus var. bisporus H97]
MSSTYSDLDPGLERQLTREPHRNLYSIWFRMEEISFLYGHPPIIGYQQAATSIPTSLSLQSLARPPSSNNNSEAPRTVENRPANIDPTHSPVASDFPIDLKCRPTPTTWDGWPDNTWARVYTWEEYVMTDTVVSTTPFGRTPPVSDISDAYLNNDRVAVQRNNILRQYKQPNGGDDFLQQLQQFHGKRPDFILHESFTTLPKTVIVLQTPWMREQSVHDATLDGPYNGIVTDGAHGFWKSNSAVLQVSSVYSMSMDVHFLSLFWGIVKVVKSRGGDDFDPHFATVMDFSQAQREGFILAYIELYSTQPGEVRDETTLRNTAEGLLKGCTEHFRQAASHVGVKHAVVDPSKQDDFVNRVIRLSKVSAYEDYEKIARGLINEFPRATKFLAWWLRPSRAKMIMESQRAMEDDLWNLLPDTTNAQEAAHWATYRAAGTNHSLLSGLEALHAVVEAFERGDVGAKRKYFNKTHYGNDKREKRMADEHGRSHPNRDPLSNRGRTYVNDGRAPDTMAKLVGKKPLHKQRKEAALTLNETFGSIYFSWKVNSCWLDVSLVLLDNALSRGGLEFSERCCIGLPDEGGLGNILGTMQRIRSLKSSDEQESPLSLALDMQRDLVRDALFEENIIQDTKSPDMVFGWLSSFLRQFNAHQGLDVEVHAIPYFLPLYCEIHKCTGCENTGGRHCEITHRLQALFTIQLGAPEHAKFKGRLAQWFRAFLKLDETSNLPCWRKLDGVGLLCSGTRTDYRRYIISLPVILVIEFVQDDVYKPIEWYIPTTLHPAQKPLREAHNLTYELVGVSLVTSELSGNHFTARYYNPEDKSVYVYDDMHSDGRAQRMRDGSLKGHVAGFPLKVPYKHAVHHAVYHLKGGLDAQRAFYEVRLAKLKKAFSISVDTPSPSNVSTSVYTGKLSRLSPDCRTWIKSVKNRNNYDEYVDPTWASKPVELRAITPFSPESEDPIEVSDTSQTKVANINDLYQRVQTPNSEDDEDLPSVTAILSTPRTPRPFPRLTPSPTLPPGDNTAPATEGGDADTENDNDSLMSIMDSESDQGSITNANSDPLKLNCRCGVMGLYMEIEAISPPEGDMLQFLFQASSSAAKKGCNSPLDADQCVAGELATSSSIEARVEPTLGGPYVRLGVWTSASTLEEDTLDQLTDVNYVDYTPDIHQVLNPELTTLRLLLESPDSMPVSGIPILQRTRGIKENSFAYSVKDAVRGAIPLREQAGITNWLHLHLGADASQQSQWQTGPAMCHACTLWIAHKLQRGGWQKPEGKDWIQEAWRIQTCTIRMVRNDINKFCISRLERLMFEYSNHAGKAGDFLWGLNYGDLQDQWNPYKLVPAHWIVRDHKVDDLNQVIGWDYIKVLPKAEPSDTTPGQISTLNEQQTDIGELTEVPMSRKRKRSPEPVVPGRENTRGRPRGRGGSTKARGQRGRKGGRRGRGKFEPKLAPGN